MLNTGAEFVVEEEAFFADVAHDGGKAVETFVGAPDIFASAPGIVHGSDVDIVGNVFSTIDFHRRGSVEFDKCEICS